MKLRALTPTRCRLGLFFALLLVSTIDLNAQSDDWSTPFPGHRVIGNLYAVGTHGLGVFLITSDEGHILINSGLEDSTQIIQENVESLGFRMDDIRILLTMQAHYDHAGALAEIKALSGAEMWATRKDAGLLEDGGFSDPLFGGRESFAPVSVDKMISDGDVIEMGDIRLQVYEHPGHTIGSSSYSMQVHENGRDYDVVIANLGTMNPGTRLTGEATYPGIADDLAGTYASQQAMDVDVWVAAHGFQYGQHDKYKPGQAYSPDAFVDPDGFVVAVERVKETFLAQLAREQRAGGLVHVGLWVSDLDEMMSFLREISDFKKISESERSTGGKRVFLSDGMGQNLELLTATDVQAHPPFALHPAGRTAGVAHIALRVADTLEARERLKSLGYKVIQQIPDGDDEGYLTTAYGEHRMIFVEGPSGVSFELFEFRHENDLKTGEQIY